MSEMLPEGAKLHIGSGPHRLDGWINIDDVPYSEVDHVLDIRKGLPYEGARFIFAEHFIEHLPVDEALRFFRESRRALAPDGVLRITTPNLDWVWRTQYRLGQWTSPDEPVQDCFNLNKGFRGWGHQFLYNRQTLERMLLSAGFREIVFCSHGESSHPELRAIERHETWPDFPGIPHIIVAEASGVGSGTSDPSLEGISSAYKQNTDLRWHLWEYWLLSITRGLRRVLWRRRS